MIHGPPPPRLPLDLRLVDIEPQPLRVGGKVTYEVELENVGAAPFLIPWGTICDVPWNDPNNPNKLSAGVSLILDEIFREVFLRLWSPRIRHDGQPPDHAFACSW